VSFFGGFGEENFGNCMLGDKRRTRRLVTTADAIMAHPGGSLPDKMGSPALLKGLYRLMNNDQVTHASVIAPHCQRTLEKMRACPGVVLLLQDSTELNYTGKKSLWDDLGQVGRGHGRGYLCHHLLAVEAQDRQVMGLAAQRLHKRPEKRRVKESRKQKKERAGKESLLWQQTRDLMGDAPEGGMWIDVTDRGGDIFEFLERERQHNRHFVVRSKYNRKLVFEASGKGPMPCLHDWLRGLGDLGQKTLTVQEGKGRSRREAQVRIAAGPVVIGAPKDPRGLHSQEPLALWAVHVREIHPPVNQEPVEWILLTDLAAGTFEAASQVVEYYATRWVIEEYHKAQKTGCAIEMPQFTSTDRLEPMIALQSVAAVQLLKLRDAARREQTARRPATEIVPAALVRMLGAWRYGDAMRPMNVREFLLALARLGGHQNRKSDGMPGWITLWRGWTKLHSMLQGAQTQRRTRCGET
jgi:hypothetical protein